MLRYRQTCCEHPVDIVRYGLRFEAVLHLLDPGAHDALPQPCEARRFRHLQVGDDLPERPDECVGKVMRSSSRVGESSA